MKGLYLRGTIWWMSFVVDGKLHQISTRTTDRKLAERIYFKIKGEIAEGRWFDRRRLEKITLGELLEKYLREHTPSKSPASRVRDRGIVKHLMDFFGDVPLVRITPARISDYMARMRDEHYAPATINNERGLLCNAFNLAVRQWEMAEKNPVLNVRKEKVKNQRDEWLSDEQEKLFLAVSPEWLREVVRFAVNTGLRQGEILNLKWCDVDFQRKTIYIKEQKNDGKDELPLNEFALDVLMQKAKVRHLAKYHVFCDAAGNKLDPSNLRRAFCKSLKKIGITNLRFHDLRHTFATRLAHAGYDQLGIQRLMRHKSASMTQRYAHHNCESLRPGVDLLVKANKSLKEKEEPLVTLQKLDNGGV
jgi:integrase